MGVEPCRFPGTSNVTRYFYQKTKTLSLKLLAPEDWSIPELIPRESQSSNFVGNVSPMPARDSLLGVLLYRGLLRCAPRAGPIRGERDVVSEIIDNQGIARTCFLPGAPPSTKKLARPFSVYLSVEIVSGVVRPFRKLRRWNGRLGFSYLIDYTGPLAEWWK